MAGIKSSKNIREHQKYIKFGVTICFLFVIFYFISGFIFGKKQELFQFKAEEYKGEWTLEREDGSVEKFYMPSNFETEIGEHMKFYTVLPDDINDGIYLCMRTGRDYKAYIDGEEIYSFDTSDRIIKGPVVKGIFSPIPLKREYAGKTLVIDRGAYTSDHMSVNTAYIGDLLGIVNIIFHGTILSFALALVLAILCLLTIVVFAFLSKDIKKPLPLTTLACGVLCCSMWAVSDSFAFQILFRKLYFDGEVAYMLTILMPLPFCIYLDVLQNKKYELFYNVVEIIVVIEFVVACVLNFANIITFEQQLGIMDAFIVLVILAIIYLIIKDVFIGKNREYILIVYGIISLFISGICEIISINISFKTSSTTSGLWLLFGLYLLLAFAVLDQTYKLRDIQRITQEAIAATQAKSDFLANMSHEIRTPINAIMGMNEMILREAADDRIKDYARDVYSASNRLLDIVNDILDFSKIEAGKMEIVDDRYNLGELLSLVTSMIEIKASQKGLDFKVEADENLPSELWGDEKRIAEVMINILNNAVKYTERGMILFHVEGKADQRGHINLEFFVKDTGIGIRREDQDKLFLNFQRLDYRNTKNIEGTGLGLAITAKLIDLMGGSIVVDSLYGNGSRFSVTIPQKVMNSTPMGNYLEHKNVSENELRVRGVQFTAPECRILVVDDNNMNCTVISRLLEKTKIQISIAYSGQEMLDLIVKEHFDVILLDHMMPQMDGIETLQKSKGLKNSLCKGVPVIALTANAINGAKELYLEAGFTDYLCKPVRPDNLENMLAFYLPQDKLNYEETSEQN